MVNRAYQYRLYPYDEQHAPLARTFERVRVVYNRTLRYCTDAYRDTHVGRMPGSGHRPVLPEFEALQRLRSGGRDAVAECQDVDLLRCEATHRRDVNAAINIRVAGLAVLSACGESVRSTPQVGVGSSRRNRNLRPVRARIPFSQGGEKSNVVRETDDLVKIALMTGARTPCRP